MCSKLPNDFDEKAKDLEGFLKILDAINAKNNSMGGKSLQHPLSKIVIMSAKHQPVIKDAKEALRQAELALMRKEVHLASVGSLIKMTLALLDDFIKEFEGAFDTQDFVRRFKELRGRIKLEFRKKS